jgi:hypothetical protein
MPYGIDLNSTSRISYYESKIELIEQVNDSRPFHTTVYTPVGKFFEKFSRLDDAVNWAKSVAEKVHIEHEYERLLGELESLSNRIKQLDLNIHEVMVENIMER